MDLSRRPVRIALIRHGESEANLDKTIFERVPDHAIPLTPHGHEQSAEAGKELRELFEGEPVRVYVSPYLRALQTLDSLGLDDLIGLAREEPRLREQDWANYQDTADIEQQKELRNRYGHFFYRFTDGESGADVYDAVFAFECIHDLPDPVGVLAAMRRLAGDDGAVVVMDERVAETFTAPGDDVERLMYGYSLMCCLADGMSHQPSAGTGTVMRPSTLRRYAVEAGFADVEILDIANDFFRFYRLR